MRAIRSSDRLWAVITRRRGAVKRLVPRPDAGLRGCPTAVGFVPLRVTLWEAVMRIVGAALVALAALWPAIGTSAPKSKSTDKPAGNAAAAPSKPAPGTPRAVYATMPENERRTIQSDLIWTGDYNGIISADFGDNSVAAVKSFQKRNGGRETGLLNPDERGQLAESARSKRANAGWRIVEDRASGARLGVPGKLVPQSTPAASGTHWQSSRGEVQVETFRSANTTLAAALERMRKEPASRRVEYQVVKPDFFVVSGQQGGVKKFYVRAEIKDSEVRGVTILYDVAMENMLDRIVVAVSNAFTGFPTGPAVAAAAPVVRRDVEYASGIVVSADGHIVTDRAAVDGCKFVVIPGLGRADRVAEDTAADVALLRVFGARDLVPAALAGDLGGGSDATLIGIADPEKQNGGAAVSTLKARVLGADSAARPLDPAPTTGFAGSAAIDGHAKFLGMVDLRPGTTIQATMVPAETIRTFLAAQSITPASGSTSLDNAKAAVVRVICVRK
jgi:peptidoglycan hydrolase-like protein with peptidoglycan-binding domain